MNPVSKPEIRPFHERDQQIIAGVALYRSPGQDQTPVYYCAHSGVSMNPTLNALDVLEVQPYAGQRERVGDVVVFVPPDGDEPVVHRIVRITPGGIRTRGDNSRAQDNWLLQPADLAGQVVAAWRRSRRRRIAGGRAGALLALLRRWHSGLDRRISRWLHPAYRALARWKLLRRLLPRRFRPRVVTFQANGHSYTRLLLGRWVIGRYNVHLQRWDIRRPFRLIVDETTLPRDLAHLQNNRSGAPGHRQ